MSDTTGQWGAACVLPETDKASAKQVFVARQPIFDDGRRVIGYELLFRTGLENYYRSLDADKSTLDVISNSYFVLGFDDLAGGKKYFINFTRNLLTRGVPALLPRESLVVEILEDIVADEEIINACRRLKNQGYVLAMDDFVLSDQGSPLLDLADIVKIDWMDTTEQDREIICRNLLAKGKLLLAEKVETPEAFEQAGALGCTYFQGYFFSKPKVHRGTDIPSNLVAHMQLMKEANRAELSYEKAASLIQQDIALSYKLLRFLNSAWFGLRCKVDSIHHALVLLGPMEFRKWVSLISLKHLATDKPEELVVNSVARARVCEIMGAAAGMESRRSELFLMGMFSHIDSLTNMPMEEAISRLPLNDNIKRGMTNQPGPFTDLMNTVKSYELARWQDFSVHAASIPIDEGIVPGMFQTSWKWAREAFHVG